MNVLPDIYELEDVLLKLNSTMSAAEAHGALCAILCARGSADMSDWASHILGEQEQGNVVLKEALKLLNSLYQVTLVQLNDINCNFQMFLPDDEEDLRERIEALTAWCQGFVYGLAVGGLSDTNDLPEDTMELIKDIIEISKADHATEADSSEEDELAYVEIVEYLRTGTLLISEELQPLQTTQTIH